MHVAGSRYLLNVKATYDRIAKGCEEVVHTLCATFHAKGAR